ncbi:tRNA (guanosine(46)-N7)-methyltransferase TrmB [soil metagenome]
MTTAPEHPKRLIRSFVRRDGRMTDSQQRALTDLWPRYGLEISQQPLDLNHIFTRTAAKNLEVGFGNGENLLAMAKLHPEQDYIGIDIHRPGIGSLLINLAAENITNVRVFCADAVDVLQCIADQSLENVYVFFPDPWHKRKHHKRRLIQANFINLVHNKLQAGGKFHLATDWQHYAEHMLKVLTATPGFSNAAGENQYSTRSNERPLTRFEQRGQRLGHKVFDLVWQKNCG